ncbi:MAG TPA: PKD domain-containing protein, partial [Promineifilum sp.]
DAVAIYSGSTSDFPNGTPVTTENLIDAVVYGIPNDASDELLALLVDGQLPADEDGQGNVVNDSLQRCPNGDGGQRFTEPFQAGSPTPGSSNECPEDAAPFVAEVSPARDALNVPLNATIVVSFSEGVSVEDNWIEVDCLQSGQMTASHDMGPITYTLSMSMPFSANDSCEVTVFSAMVRDLDSEDPPDTMVADDMWVFQTATEGQPVVAGFTSNGSIWVDQAAVFTNTSTGPAPLEFNWDFGDGSPVSNEVNPTHFYPAPGSYIVELTATSGSLSDIYSQTMVVLNATAFLPAVLGATESPDSSPNSRSNLAIRRH